MNDTDLKPGDLVRHPEHGYGVVLKNFPGVPTIYFAGEHGYENTTRRFTGWERAESTPPADEKPTSATVTLFCPDCGEAITRTAQVWTGSQRDRTLTWATLGWHTCPPAQPDEPTEFGAKVVVSYPNGTSVRLIRVVDDSTKSGYAWMAESGRVLSWDDLGTYATVSLGWDE